MTAQNNAACVAVKAEPCQKQTKEPVLPSMRQAMALAINLVSTSLRQAINLIRNDDEWETPDIDAEYAVEHVLEHLQHLLKELPADRSVFDRKWLEAGSILKLAVRNFPLEKCAYFNILSAACKKFDVMFAAVEHADLEARRHGA